MRILVLGCGPMGYAIVKDLVKDDQIDEVAVVDISSKRLENLKTFVKSDKVITIQMDVTDKSMLLKTMKNFDCIAGALPHRLTVHADRTAIEAGVDMVDLAFEPEQLELDDMAKKAGVTLIPGCGVAPGLSNMLVAYGASKMDVVEEVCIRVGGIPFNPTPPLDYKIVFSVESVIAEYCRPVRIVKDGQLIRVPALSGIEKFTLPELGELECFYTDGLSTLINTMKGVKSMCEKTIRWPGHAEKVKVLRDLGFFDADPIEIGGVKISPRLLSAKLMNEKLRMEEGDKDITVLLVDVVGNKGNLRVHCNYKMIDYYDDVEKLTSMGRTTGFTCTIMMRMVLKGEVKGPGVIPPELALTPKQFEYFANELAKRGIYIHETVTTSRTMM
ncbi:MAG: saccharopine dehydrogenase [Candidatus Methanomethylicota archaeon]|uniref:Saccharopine dehydrogenase n=1 Tax=Thermoproteota archaeon TaxID=2056631 RepID=A0A497EZW8_9CREN|nr:MAG: saccharopine dehydrogenase [Candidatus Verstraetearchaeota archaeon]